MAAMSVNNKNFEKEILKSDIPALVNVCAEWCFQCRVVDPIIDDLADEYKGKFKIAKLNYNKNKTTAAKYDIKSIPTLLIFIKGEMVERFDEVDPEKDFNAILDKYIKKKPKKTPKA